jgi:hypothetical protein
MEDHYEGVLTPGQRTALAGLFGPSRHRMALDPYYAVKDAGGRYACREHGGDYDYDAMAAHLTAPGHE